MDGHTFLSWNIPNTVTVWLMALLLIVLLKTGNAWYQNRNASNS